MSEEFKRQLEHINQELFGKYFHGTTFRHGHIKKGDVIRPAEDLGVEPNHARNYFPESGQWAHAVHDAEQAWLYARWAAKGDHQGTIDDEKMGVSYKPHVFEVEPVGESHQDPRDFLSVRAKAFRVLRRVPPTKY